MFVLQCATAQTHKEDEEENLEEFSFIFSNRSLLKKLYRYIHRFCLHILHYNPRLQQQQSVPVNLRFPFLFLFVCKRPPASWRWLIKGY